jgi:hypothetical protein
VIMAARHVEAAAGAALVLPRTSRAAAAAAAGNADVAADLAVVVAAVIVVDVVAVADVVVAAGVVAVAGAAVIYTEVDVVVVEYEFDAYWIIRGYPSECLTYQSSLNYTSARSSAFESLLSHSHSDLQQRQIRIL